MNFPESALLVSVPYLPKDILSLILAYVLGLQIRKQLLRAAILPPQAPKKAPL